MYYNLMTLVADLRCRDSLSRHWGLKWDLDCFSLQGLCGICWRYRPSPSFDPLGVLIFAFHSLCWPRASHAAEFPVLQGHLARHLPWGRLQDFPALKAPLHLGRQGDEGCSRTSWRLITASRSAAVVSGWGWM